MHFINKLKPKIMFYVGQKVVALRSHAESGLVKDTIYTISQTFKCSCGKEFVSWGVKYNAPKDICDVCRCDVQIHYEYFGGAKNFAPLEEYTDSMSLAMQLVQEIDQTDKQKIFNPKRETVKN